LKIKIAEIFCTLTKAARISNFNPVMQIDQVYRTLLPELKYQFKKKTEQTVQSFSSQKFYSDKQYICFKKQKTFDFADTSAVFMAMA